MLSTLIQAKLVPKAPYQQQFEEDESQHLADRRSSSTAARLCAGIFLLYQRATGMGEADPFIRDEKTWIAFEEAALPEMRSFSFYDRSRNMMRTPASVLADAMGHIWLAKSPETPATIQVITELANRIASLYQIEPIERRTRKRASLGLDVLA